MKHLLTSTAIIAALTAGCAREVAPHYVSDGNGHAAVTSLPDGSQVSLIMGGTGADPQNTQQRMDGGYVHTYWLNGKLHSDFDSRPTVSPALGLEAAQIIVPPLIEGGATVGAGVLVDSGLQNAARIGAYGNYESALANAAGTVKGDAEIAKGLAAQKPPVINATASASASATGGAGGSGGSVVNTFNPTNVNSQFQQQQQQQKITVPSEITIKSPPVY
jgi:hypothetical protein